jgi:polyisoprenoid-binding protein YceI
MKTMLRKLLTAMLCMLYAVCVNADGAATSAGEIKFMASQEGVTLQGTFNEFAANVKFDPAQPEAGAVRVSVDVGSVSTGSPSANELIKSPDFFDAAAYPQATFEASEFHAQEGGRYIATGIFSLKGHSVTLPVTFVTTNGPQGRWFDGTFTISRTLFKVGQGEWSDTSTLDDPVQILFHIAQ